MKPVLKISLLSLILIAAACQQKKLPEEKPVWVPGWKETSSLSTPRTGAATVVHNGFIYIIAGVDGKNFLTSTEYAKINDDGSLSPWKKGTELKEPRGFTDAIIYKGYIYVVGGGKGEHGKILLRSVERSRILPDGSLSPWELVKASLNVPRRCSKVELIGNRLATFGGFGGDLLNLVEHADFSEDGELGEWLEEGEKLLKMRYINSVSRAGEIIYIVGGHHQTEGVGITDVEWSKVVDWAGFQKWQQTTPMSTGRYGLETAIHKDNLYALGGLSGAEYLSSSEKTKIKAGGGLSKWSATTPLSMPRTMFNAVVYKDWVYVMGGSNSDGYPRKVEYATFDKNGDIGYWSDKAGLDAFEKKALEKKRVGKKNLPNEGIVVEILQASRYTYMLVVKKDGREWIAGPKKEIAKGTRVAYSKGVFMSKFYSKELKKAFPSVLFVGTIEMSGN